MAEIDTSSKSYPEGWDITCKRYVSVIDIMGFKDMVARNSHEKIYNLLKKVSHAMSSTQFIFGTEVDDEDDFYENVIFMTYSDSIMVYSRDNSKESTRSFIGSISALQEELFKGGIPFKGAVANGKMTVDYENSIYFGQPLIDAFLLQEELQFYGIVVHASAEFFKFFREDENIIEYTCQFKVGKANHYLILPGNFILKDPLDLKNINLLKKWIHKLKINTSGGLRKYIDNTITYIEYSESVILKELNEVEEKRKKDYQSDDNLPF